MDLAEARSFLAAHHRAVLVTTRADGGPQMSPVLCALDPEGRVVVSTRETAMKTKNALRNPTVSLCVLSDGFFGDWAQIDGKAEIVSLPGAMEGLVDQYRILSGEHPDWDEFRAAMVAQKRVLLRVEIERAGPDRSG